MFDRVLNALLTEFLFTPVKQVIWTTNFIKGKRKFFEAGKEKQNYILGENGGPDLQFTSTLLKTGFWSNDSYRASALINWKFTRNSLPTIYQYPETYNENICKKIFDLNLKRCDYMEVPFYSRFIKRNDWLWWKEPVHLGESVSLIQIFIFLSRFSI